MYTYCDNLILIASQIIVHNNNIKYGVASGGFGVLLIFYLGGRGKGSHKTFNYRCFLDSPLKAMHRVYAKDFTKFLHYYFKRWYIYTL